jgi:hypothetical protein
VNDSHRPAFAKGIGALALSFGRPIDQPLLEAYWLLLRDLDLEQFVAAVVAAGKTLKWFPKPVEILELAGAGPTATAALRKAAIAQAWEAVRTAMDRYDYTHSVDFGPLVNAVIRNLGGWQYLCSRSLRDLVWDRKKFEELYEAFAVSRCELRGDPLSGRFGGEPVRIAIPGQGRPPRQLEAVAETDWTGLIEGKS